MNIYNVKEENSSDSLFIIIDNFLDKNELDKLKDKLRNISDWKTTKKYNGKGIKRLQKWYQINNLNFGKNWVVENEQWKSNKYENYLLELQTLMQNKINNFYQKYNYIEKSKFNSILINYYQNGNQGIAPHKDDPESFGLEPTIALLSIDGPRTFCIERTKLDSLKRDKDKSFQNKEFVLPDNSLLIMGGGSQRNFCHFIKDEPHIKSSRYSLTFREFLINKN
tara:strand:+ start:3226 stop:3894 length:669 start_codon:yes stop_codon:yes gene_type:complete